MSFDASKIAEIQTIPSSAGAVYTNPASTTTYITCIIIHNANTSAEEVQLWKVPEADSGTQDDTNQFFRDTIKSYDTAIIPFPWPGIVLDTENDAIEAKTTTASKVTIQFSGGTE